MKIVFSSALGLVVSDGTVAGTSVIKAADTGPGGFVLTYRMISFGSGALFVAAAGTGPGPDGGDNKLWFTDGTAGGTALAVTLPDDTVYSAPPTEFSSANVVELTAAGTRVVFNYTPGDPFGGAVSYGLWSTDGTAAGTFQLQSSAAGLHASGVLANGKLVFAGAGLEVTDGTAAGTITIVSGSAIGTNGFANLGSILVYGAAASDQLWRTDGTVAGTVPIEQIPAAAGAVGLSDIGSFEVFGARAVFDLYDGLHAATALWVTDGTAAGTLRIPGITNPRLSVTATGENLLSGPIAGTRLILISDEGMVATDGTAAGTAIVLAAAAAPIGPGVMTTLGSKVLFVGRDPNQIWETDGTAAGTHLAVQMPGSSLGVTSMTTVGTHVLFEYVATDTTPAGAVWTTDGTQAGTTLVLDSANALFTPGAFAEVVECFAAGTRIGTPGGQVAVETLRPGDAVTTVSGDVRTIQWIGRRRVSCLSHPEPETVWPVRIAPHAFGENAPVRPLYLSPGHAVFVDGVLIPAKYWIDDGAIRQIRVDRVDYYHVELAGHDAIFAEGLPVETYLDAGDRANFERAGGPSFGLPGRGAAAWEMAGFAPLIVTGPDLRAARRTRVARARTVDLAERAA